MKILGIETSCDETAGAIVEDGVKILSNIVASSAEMHIKSGGIIPEEAARQQVKSILPVIQNSLSDAKTQLKEIDAIAVTVGPGLVGSLLVGIETAKTLSYVWKKPVVPVNHLVAHIYANWLIPNNPPEFPALALVVSGGHTDLVLMKDHGKITWIGGTRDDAAGEAFDKCARLLGLSYPGGPSISKEAEKFLNSNNNSLKLFPRPMIDEKNFDFSFSGLKTAVLREIQNRKSYVLNHKSYFAAEVQEAIVDVLVEKTFRALVKFKPKSFLLAGGVAANKRLREKFKLEIDNLRKQNGYFNWKLSARGGSSFGRKIDFRVPPSNLCTDNASYIASCAFFNFSPSPWQDIATNPELPIAKNF